MIPVQLQHKLSNFDELVANPGNLWLSENGIREGQSIPEGVSLPNYWVKVLPDFWRAYSGVCAYYSFYFELASGAQSTDHFSAKSTFPNKAYEWENLRLACLEANRQKNKHSDVFDPMEIEQDTFRLNLIEGTIYPNPEKGDHLQEMARKTIDRLELDEYMLNELRARHYHWYKTERISLEHLKDMNPFVYTEVVRQDQL